MNEIFKTLESYNEPMYDTNKLSALLDKYANNHAEFKSTVLMCQILHITFNTAVTDLKTEFGRIFPDVREDGGKNRTISYLSSKVKGKVK